MDLIKILINAGANPESRDELSGRTALHLAIEKKNFNLVMYLIKECNAELYATTYAGMTALQLAECVDSNIMDNILKTKNFDMVKKFNCI